MKYYLAFFLVFIYFKAVENVSFRCDYTFINNINGWMKLHEVPATWVDARFKCALEENASFRCDYKFIYKINGWMKLHEVPATWVDARFKCALEGGILASPSSCRMRLAMLKMMKSTPPSRKHVFTGLHSILSQGAFYTIDGISMMEFDYTWAQGQPDNLKNDESCLTFNMDGELSDVNCDDPLPYICYKSNKPETKVNRCGTTDDGYIYHPETNLCYKMHTLQRNFWHANFVCFAEGGNLVVIKSEQEEKLLQKLYNKYNSEIKGEYRKDIAFIGFHDWGERRIWRTLFGQTLKEAGFDKFTLGEPNNHPPGEYCGSIFQNYSLNDMYCEACMVYICEKKPNFPRVCNTRQLRGK